METSLIHQGNITKVNTHRSPGNGPHHTQVGALGSRALGAGPGGPGVAERGRVWHRRWRGRGLHSAEHAVMRLRAAGCQDSWEEE